MGILLAHEDPIWLGSSRCGNAHLGFHFCNPHLTSVDERQRKTHTDYLVQPDAKPVNKQSRVASLAYRIGRQRATRR